MQTGSEYDGGESRSRSTLLVASYVGTNEGPQSTDDLCCDLLDDLFPRAGGTLWKASRVLKLKEIFDNQPYVLQLHGLYHPLTLSTPVLIRIIRDLIWYDWFLHHNRRSHFDLELHLRTVVSALRLLSAHGVGKGGNGTLGWEFWDGLYNRMRWFQDYHLGQVRNVKDVDDDATLLNYNNDFLIIYARDLISSIPSDQSIARNLATRIMAGAASVGHMYAKNIVQAAISLKHSLQFKHPPSNWHLQYRQLDDLCLSVKTWRQWERSELSHTLSKSTEETLGGLEESVVSELADIVMTNPEIQRILADPNRITTISRKAVDAVGASPLGRNGHYAYGLLDLIQQFIERIDSGKVNDKVVKVCLHVVKNSRKAFLRCKAFELLAVMGGRPDVGAMPARAVRELLDRVVSDDLRDKIGAEWRAMQKRWVDVRDIWEDLRIKTTGNGSPRLPAAEPSIYTSREEPRLDGSRGPGEILSLVQDLESLLLCPFDISEDQPPRDLIPLVPCGHYASRSAWEQWQDSQEEVGEVAKCPICMMKVESVGSLVDVGRIGQVIQKLRAEATGLAMVLDWNAGVERQKELEFILSPPQRTETALRTPLYRRRRERLRRNDTPPSRNSFQKFEDSGVGSTTDTMEEAFTHVPEDFVDDDEEAKLKGKENEVLGLFQDSKTVSRTILTASGGPLSDSPLSPTVLGSPTMHGSPLWEESFDINPWEDMGDQNQEESVWKLDKQISKTYLSNRETERTQINQNTLRGINPKVNLELGESGVVGGPEYLIDASYRRTEDVSVPLVSVEDMDMVSTMPQLASVNMPPSTVSPKRDPTALGRPKKSFSLKKILSRRSSSRADSSISNLGAPESPRTSSTKRESIGSGMDSLSNSSDPGDIYQRNGVTLQNNEGFGNSRMLRTSISSSNTGNSDRDADIQSALSIPPFQSTTGIESTRQTGMRVTTTFTYQISPLDGKKYIATTLSASGNTFALISNHKFNIYTISENSKVNLVASGSSEERYGPAAKMGVEESKDLVIRNKPTEFKRAAINDHILAIALAKSCLDLFDTSTGHRLGTLNFHSGRCCMSIAISPDDRILAVGMDHLSGDILLYPAGIAQNYITVPEEISSENGDVTAIAFSRNSMYMATCVSSSVINVWNVAVGERATLLSKYDRKVGRIHDPRVGVTGLAFTVDHKSLMIISDADNGYPVIVKNVISLKEGHPVHYFDESEYKTKNRLVAYSPRAEIAVMVTRRGNVKLINCSSGVKRWKVKELGDLNITSETWRLASIGFNTAGTRILGIDRNGTLLITEFS